MPRNSGALEYVTYVCNTGTITGATATGTKSLAYLWHASTVTLDYRLLGVNVNQVAGAAGGQRIELRRITAENATPGGTTGTIFPTDPGATASGGSVRIAPTGAPTIQTGVYMGGDLPVASNGNAWFPVVNTPMVEDALPPLCRAGSAEGWLIVQEVTATITTAPVFNITFLWGEL